MAATHKFAGMTAEQINAALLAEEMADMNRIVWKGFTRRELDEALKPIQNPQNWKEELIGIIRFSDLDKVRAAAEFFCGSPLHILHVEPEHFGPERKACVKGPGYYRCIGA